MRRTHPALIGVAEPRLPGMAAAEEEVARHLQMDGFKDDPSEQSHRFLWRHGTGGEADEYQRNLTAES